MRLVYFEGKDGVVGLVADQITGFRERRRPTDFPTAVMLSGGQEVEVRNSADVVQVRLMGAHRDGREPVIPQQPTPDRGR